MNLIKEHAKTIAAFFAVYLANAIFDLATGGRPWPQNGDEWLQYALTTVAAGVGAFAVRNKITQSQLDKDKNVIGGTVVPDAQIPSPSSDSPPRPTPGLGGGVPPNPFD